VKNELRTISQQKFQLAEKFVTEKMREVQEKRNTLVKEIEKKKRRHFLCNLVNLFILTRQTQIVKTECKN